jgi:hypothetical protein
MIEYINRFRRTIRKEDALPKGGVSSSSDLPLDHRLTFKPDKDERWTYEGDGHIYINDMEVEDLIDSERTDVRFLCGLSSGLREYQLFVWSKGGEDRASFNGMVDALQDKIHVRLCDMYEYLTVGVQYDISDGELFVNNIAVRKLLAIFYSNPTEKLRVYLSGIRNKLALIIERRRSTNEFDAVYREATSLFDDVSAALEFIPPDAPYRLCDGARNV